MADIAKAANTTRNTVSVALRNKPGVSEETRVRIQAIAEKMGYRPNPLVSTLMGAIRSTRPIQCNANIAFIHCLDGPNQWRGRNHYENFFEGARQRGEFTGFSVSPVWLHESGANLKRMREMLLARGVSGVIIGPVEMPRRHILFPWDDFAVATIGLSLWRPKLHRAHSDLTQCMCLAVSELNKLNYQRIGIAYTDNSDSKFDYAWSSAVGREMANRPKCLCRPFIGNQGSINGFDEWLEREQPDAIIDATIHHLYDYLLGRGLSIPEKIGYVDLVRSDLPSEVATVHRDLSLLGAAALDIVTAQLMRNERGLPQNRRSVVIEGVWHPGKTVCQRAEK